MVTVRYPNDIYPKVAVLKAAYHMIDRCYIHIDTDDRDLIVEITPKDGFEDGKLSHEMNNEVLAQTVRYGVYQQTHEIREILVARAMASTVLNATPESPVLPDDKPENSLDDILTDWFEKYENVQ